MKMEAETEAKCLQFNDCQGLPEASRNCHGTHSPSMSPKGTGPANIDARLLAFRLAVG